MGKEEERRLRLAGRHVSFPRAKEVPGHRFGFYLPWRPKGTYRRSPALAEKGGACKALLFRLQGKRLGGFGLGPAGAENRRGTVSRGGGTVVTGKASPPWRENPLEDDIRLPREESQGFAEGGKATSLKKVPPLCKRSLGSKFLPEDLSAGKIEGHTCREKVIFQKGKGVGRYRRNFLSPATWKGEPGGRKLSGRGKEEKKYLWPDRLYRNDYQTERGE